VWTEEHEVNFRNATHSRISQGSMLAWLGHLNAIQWFLSTKLETVLILEDDVDFSAVLRTAQIPLASRAFNKLMNTSDPTKPPTAFSHPDTNDYWSDVNKWEILHLGHCGDFPLPHQFDKLAHTIYTDPTMLSPPRLHSKTSAFLRKCGLDSYQRTFHRSLWPLCTFGYALNRRSAQRMLDNYSTEGPGGCQAFDVRTLEACRDHDWKCYTLNPEVFHHIEAASEIANVNEGIDDHGRLQRMEGAGATPNIFCGARGPGLRTEKEDEFDFLRENVEKGVCFGDGVGEDRGRWP
jgi:hypothetical protein